MSPNEKKDPIPAALLMLTLVTGIVDAVSVLALGHVFTANMTGNVVFLGFAVAGASQFSIARSLASLIAFLMGAVLGGRLSVAMAGSIRRRWLLSTAVLALAVGVRRRVGVMPVVLAGVVLYWGMYLQGTRPVMYAAIVVGMATLAAAYVWSTRPRKRDMC